MYLDEACTEELPFREGSLPYPPPVGCDASAYPLDPKCDKTFTDITSTTNVYTGVYAKSHYPGEYWNQYWNGNLFDQNPYTSWWSSSLELNPELKNGDAVTIEWLVSGVYDVKCVKIFQEEYHSMSKLVLERGPVYEQGPCLMEETQKYMDHPTKRCKPTVTAVATFAPTDVQKLEGTFKHSCGVP